VLIQDADTEYDPNDYPAMIRLIVEGRSDVVMGSGFIFCRPKFIGTRQSLQRDRAVFLECAAR